MSEEAYRVQVRRELLANRTTGRIGFRDSFGFIVDFENDRPTTRGEGTLHTAIAAIAVAAGSYHRDNWEENNANNRLDELLQALSEGGWGNRDGLGRQHPVRHPDKKEYDPAGNVFRLSPLSKDGFGAVLCACLYSYKSPHSSQAVRQRAEHLMQKWTEYMVLNQFRTHSQYIAGEFEYDLVDGNKVYKKIYSDNGRRVSHKGPEAFLLLPHEIYALQSVAASLGQQTSGWDVWADGMGSALKQAITDIAAPYIGAACGRAISSILDHLVWSIPYSIPLGGLGWEFGKIEGVFSFGIPDDVRLAIEEAFSTAITDIIREAVRLNTLIGQQGDQILGSAIGRILDLFPEVLGPDKWRSILTLGLKQISPWLNGANLIEALTLAGTLQLLKTQKTYVQSYSVWSYIAVFETRPELADLLRPLVQEFFSALRGQGNPIGMWAWLAEDSARVNEHLERFYKTSTGDPESPYRWGSFAYGATAYNDWVTRTVPEPLPGAKQSPRLDYLVLQGLNEKGYPRGLSDVASDWLEEFKTAMRGVFTNFLERAEELLKEFGIVTLEGLSKIDVHADTPLIPPVELHGDASHGDAHGDMGHADEHGDAGHGDAHGDAGHGDAHGDAGHGDAHGDAGHGDAHGDTGAHVDFHSDAFGTGPHGDAGGLGVHLDFSAAGGHGDSRAVGVHGDSRPVNVHGDSSAVGVHADAGSVGTHADSQQVGIHADTPEAGHVDAHGDVANHGHMDTALIPPIDFESNTPHGDGHGDAGHGDGHGDAGHGDAHGDAVHGDAHGDAGHGDAHSDIGHGDAHGDVGHFGGGPHADWGSVGIHGDSRSVGVHGDSPAVGLHGDSSTVGAHGDSPNTGIHGDIPKKQIHGDTPKIGHGDVHIDANE